MISNKSTKINFGILTVSDSCSQGTAEDRSGTNLAALIIKGLIPNGKVVLQNCVPDEKDCIKRILEEWTDREGVDVILTTGGTGFSSRDVTPEATKEVIHRETSGLTFAMFKKSLDITPLAMLSRATTGIRYSTLIINLPGSVKGSQECLESVAISLSHAVAVLRDRIAEVKSTHTLIQSNMGNCPSHRQKHSHQEHHHYHGNSKVDPTQVARRARESPYPLIDVATAQMTVLEHAEVLGTEMVDFTEALGRVLAEDVFAKDPLPPFPASIKDGYAVLASDGAGKRQVLGSSIAGVNVSALWWADHSSKE
ncbi:hypothetical protein B7P43_G12825, partial [Cryptotermes secundus]